MQFDLPLEKLRQYRAPDEEPADFDQFWTHTLASARSHPLSATFDPHDAGLPAVDVFDVEFAGWAGDRVAAWLILPRGVRGPLPAVVEYIGYGAGRGLAHDHLLWSAAGFAHLVVDTRGQGSSINGVGRTDDDAGPIGPHSPGFLTMGIENPERYYYRRVFTDASRAVEVARAHPLIDAGRVIVTGGSQGGGIALAVAGLVPDLAALMTDVPFLCHYRRAVQVTDARPYLELTQYLSAHRDRAETAFRTLSYFDGVSFAARAAAPALFSVALMDQTCPPSTVFAAYNNYAGAPKRITVYPYNNHEGGGSFHRIEQLTYAAHVRDGGQAG
jgi:cephalosporin-C deacetylase